MKTIFITILLFALVGCSNPKKITFTPPLKTQFQNDQYFYCENCPEPTNLEQKQYYILEPDKPIPIPNNDDNNLLLIERRTKPNDIKTKKYKRQKVNLSKCNYKGK